MQRLPLFNSAESKKMGSRLLGTHKKKLSTSSREILILHSKRTKSKRAMDYSNGSEQSRAEYVALSDNASFTLLSHRHSRKHPLRLRQKVIPRKATGTHHGRPILVEFRLEAELLSQLLAGHSRIQSCSHRENRVALSTNLTSQRRRHDTASRESVTREALTTRV